MKAPKASRKGCIQHQLHKLKAVHVARSEEQTTNLNSDALGRLLGKDNLGFTIIKGQRLLVLLDTGVNVNMITPECVEMLGLSVGPMTDLRKEGITVNQPFDY